jgi:peptidyl-prolyl cis-trans isomerase C
MKAIFLTLLACLSCLAQTAATQAAAPAMPDLPEDAVIGTFADGGKMTMGEFRKVFAVLPPEQQQLILRDRKTFLESWAFMRRLSQLAEQDKLNEESPTREQLAYYHMFLLSNAKIQDVMNRTTVDPGEIVKYYDANKDRYKQVNVKAIYIAFSASPEPGSKALTEAQALAKAEKLLAQLKEGADFSKLAEAESDDKTSRAKGGDFTVLNANDTAPPAIKSAVFALKQGEVTAPVKQSNGFYIFRAQEVTFRPLSQVRDEIYNQLKEQNVRKWMDKESKDSKPVANPAFIGPAAPNHPK